MSGHPGSPHTQGDLRHRCWWRQSPSLHAWNRMLSLQCLQGGLCVSPSLADTLSKTNPAPQQPQCPSLLPPAPPSLWWDAWGTCGVSGTRGSHRVWARARSHQPSPHATAESSCGAQQIGAGRVAAVPPVLPAPSQAGMTQLPSHPCTHHSSTCLMESIYMQNPQKKAVINEVPFITIMQMRLISAVMNMQILQL